MSGALDTIAVRAHRVRQMIDIVSLGRTPTDSAKLAAARAGRGEQTLHVRELGDQAITIRPFPDTVDILVVGDVFCGLYHVPPPDLHPATILDLGANIGLTMAHYAVLFPGARIVGVELDARNAVVARRNTAAFGARCEVLTAGVWTEDGQVAYDPGADEYAFRIGAGEGTAPALTITSLLERCGWQDVDYVKMDIEGAEREVLRDGAAWADRVGCLCVEAHGDYTAEECAEDLTRLGFRVRRDLRGAALLFARR